MDTHRTTSTVPGWYIRFQTALLANAPRPGNGPGQITQEVALKWCDDGVNLKSSLAKTLLPREIISHQDIMDTINVDYSLRTNFLGDFKISEEPKNIGVMSINISKIRRMSVLKGVEKSQDGEETLRRLKSSDIVLLDARVLEELLKYPNRIPDKWKKGATYFWGTIMVAGGTSTRYVPCLYWDSPAKKWSWTYKELWQNFDAEELAAYITT